VGVGELGETARTIARQLTALDMTAHAASKLRARGQALRAIRAGIDADGAAFHGRDVDGATTMV
jgi:hypothetical protein